MREKSTTALVALLAALSLLAACGNDDTASENKTHTASNGDTFNDADVTFASDMIQHHSQALAMVDLTTGRQLDPEFLQLAEDIREAQAPEIEIMADWLTEWDEPIPETVRDHVNAHGDGEIQMDPDMPGMMSAEQMAGLEGAQGEEFQRRFLDMMIEHHEGATEMAQTEQSDGKFRPARKLAAMIESAQQEEIAYMETLLGS